MGELSLVIAQSYVNKSDVGACIPGLKLLMMWQVRAYLRAVAAGELTAVHGPHSSSIDHRRVFNKTKEHIEQLASTWPAPQVRSMKQPLLLC